MALDCQSLLVNSTYLQKVMGQALMMSMIWEFNPIPLSLSLSLSLSIYILIWVALSMLVKRVGPNQTRFNPFFLCDGLYCYNC